MRRWRRNSIWLFAIGCCMLMGGCRPKGVLSRSELGEVLYELHRADGVLAVAGYEYGHDQEVARYYQAVLDRHGLSRAQFDSTIVWYTDHPALFDKVYPGVMERLNADLNAVKAMQEKQPVKDLNLPAELQMWHEMGEKYEKNALKFAGMKYFL